VAILSFSFSDMMIAFHLVNFGLQFLIFPATFKNLL